MNNMNYILLIAYIEVSWQLHSNIKYSGKLRVQRN